MDMNDKVAQYGFVILFGVVFPLSPLLAAVMEIFTRFQDIKRWVTSICTNILIYTFITFTTII